jgi:hypothetical protein
MACDGFTHGMEVRADKELIHFGRVIKEGTIGKIEKIDHDKHQIDVRFEKFGVVRGLPAHSFGAATAGMES